jgi:hypothetical protein
MMSYLPVYIQEPSAGAIGKISWAWHNPCSHRLDHRNHRTRREDLPRLTGQQQVFFTAYVDYQTLHDHHSSESCRTC